MLEPRSLRASSPRAIAAGGIGYFIENYNWFMYGILAALFSQEIFPDKTPIASLIAALLTYTVGFLVRPLGAFVFSPIGDKYGRRIVMSVTIALMSLGSLLISMTPSYAVAGAAAPIIFLIARVLQGLAEGGEMQSAIPFMCEHAASERRGVAGSVSQVAGGLAALAAGAMAGLVTWLVPEPELAVWGWRIPFALGALAGLFGIYLRWGVSESPEFERIKLAGKIVVRPIREVLRRHPLALLQIAALQATTVAFYIFATFLPTYAKLTAGNAFAGSFIAGALGISVFIVLAPTFGYISDRIHNRKVFAVTSAFALVIMLYPLFVLLSVGGFWSYLVVAVIGWATLSMVFGVYPALFVELLPPELRVTGIGLSYNLTTALLGGTAPLLAAWFISIGFPLGICFYMMGIMLLAGIIYLTLPRYEESRQITSGALPQTPAMIWPSSPSA